MWTIVFYVLMAGKPAREIPLRVDHYQTLEECMSVRQLLVASMMPKTGVVATVKCINGWRI